jgi:hypothetical protein
MWLHGLERRVARLEALFAARRERERRALGEIDNYDYESPEEMRIRLLIMENYARRKAEAEAEAAMEPDPGSEWSAGGCCSPGATETSPAEAGPGDCVEPAAAPVPVDAAPPAPAAPPSPAAPVVRRFARPCEAPGAMPCGLFCRLGGGADCRALARRGFALAPAFPDRAALAFGNEAVMHSRPAPRAV